MSKKPDQAVVAVTQSSLLAIAQEANEITRLIIQSGGELSPELEARLDLNGAKLMAKVDAYVAIEDELAAQEALWKARAQAVAEMAKRFGSNRERLRERVKLAMAQLGTTEVQGEFHRYKLSVLKPKLVIVDEAALPKEFQIIITTHAPDKERILAALNEGFEVPGARLEPVTRLATYEAKE